MIDLTTMFPRPVETGDQSMDVKFEPRMVNGLYVPSALVGLWVHFTDISGSGVSVNTIVVKIDSYTAGVTYDQCVESRAKVGIATGGTVTDYVLTVTADYAHKYIMELDPENPNNFDRINVTWTNDAAGDVRWSVKIGIVPLTALT